MFIRKMLLLLMVILAAAPLYAQDEPTSVIDAALADLSAQLGETVTRENVTSYSWTAQEFSDASLGCPQEGQMYAQVLTRGYLLLFTFEDTTYDYRVSEDGQTIVLCGSTPVTNADAQAAPGGTMLLSAGPITAESAAQVAELGQIELQDTTASAMDWSPAGDVIAVAGDGIWLYSTSTPQATPLQVGGDAPVTALSFDQTGQMIAAGFADGAVRILDSASVGGVVEAQATGGQSISSVAVSPDGQEIATGSDDGVGVWSASNGEPVDTVDADNTVGSVAFSPNGDLLAYGVGDGSIHLVDTASNEEVRVLESGHTDTIHDLEFSPDGSLLASASADGTVRLWDVQTGEEVSTLDSDAVSVAFSPDGSVLSSASGNTIDLWDVETRDNLASLTGHEAAVSDLSFSPTGEFLASLGADGTLRLWGASFAAGT